MECFNPLTDKVLKASQLACHLDFPSTLFLYYDNDRHIVIPLVAVHLPPNQNLMGTSNGLSNMPWELEFSGNDCR